MVTEECCVGVSTPCSRGEGNDSSRGLSPNSISSGCSVEAAENERGGLTKVQGPEVGCEIDDNVAYHRSNMRRESRIRENEDNWRYDVPVATARRAAFYSPAPP